MNRPDNRAGRRYLAAAVPALVLVAALAGCTAVATGDAGTTVSTVSALGLDASLSASEVLALDQESHADASDLDYDSADAVTVSLDGDTASADGDGVTVSGSTVTITTGGTYVLGGELDGRVVVDAADTALVRLVLDGVDISSQEGAAIAVTAAEKVVVLLADGSSNSLGDTSSYAEGADVNAALFSAADLTIAGDGSLEVSGNGNDGIASKDGLVIESGTVTVTAVDDGIRGKDYVIVNGGEVTVEAGGDGIKADNDEDEDRGYISVTGGTLTVDAGGDGLQAETDLVVTGGTLAVTTASGSDTAPTDETSAKGLKAGAHLVLEGGTVDIDASDDAVHSNGVVHISDGEALLASGDDGVHADGTVLVDGGDTTIIGSYEGLEGGAIIITAGSLDVTASDDGINVSGGADGSGMQGPGEQAASSTDAFLRVDGGTIIVDASGDGIDVNGSAEVTGGTIVVAGPTDNGNGALDVDGTFVISGGTLVAAGSSGMVVAPSEDSTQGWVAFSFADSLAAGETATITDASGTVLGAYTTQKATQSIVFSVLGLADGESYTATTGGATSGADTAGYASSGTAGSTVAATAVAGEAPAGGMAGGGGMPGGDRGGPPARG
ncbi:uncharacterized protein DUF4353 [Homoserinimonas aerilata]|uniref:Uncharacterized protein DUF4353 n=1 Tax=Homoserinimonas aerilata TaxID=1162970 RepID=A0A542YGI8_9MICO|nr:carbohydrate-binding domain-containing protein [Homoserinimonas aerilata]TQL47185.1 uncharacterized protein DUF4353 [Homoserinimonas aerilata]